MQRVAEMSTPSLSESNNSGGEITLEDYELCNLVETCPTRCPDVESWYRACKFATTYASTVSLLPTHRPETNRVVSRNRRIGVGIIDWTGWVHQCGLQNVTKYMRRGYKIVRSVNETVNAEAGVPSSIKVTTMKPGGSVPKLPGLTSGLGYPTFKYTIRRIRVAANHPMVRVLKAAGIPNEPEKYDQAGTLVFSFPIIQGPSEPATEVSLWQQAVNLATVQREWADNAVSNTLYFKPKWQLILSTNDKFTLYERQQNEGWNYEEDPHSSYVDTDGKYKVQVTQWGYELYKFNPDHEEDQILKVLAAFAPLIKSCSLLPHTANGVYEQTPEEGITEEQYNILKAGIKKIDWSGYRGSDGEDEKYCQGDVCELPKRN
jgi:ribonucleoside-triphosphate reductase (thioredoxin)